MGGSFANLCGGSFCRGVIMATVVYIFVLLGVGGESGFVNNCRHFNFAYCFCVVYVFFMAVKF